jgi:hypothetical protein
MLSLRQTLWLLPLAFMIHDGEEIITMPRWLAENADTLRRIGDVNATARALLEIFPRNTAGLAIAVGVLGAFIVVATILASRDPKPGFSLYCYAAVLGVFAFHAITHVAQAAILERYTPGVVTAVLLIPPATTVIYRRLFDAGLLTRRAAILSGVAGAALIPWVFLLALYTGKSLAG